MARPKTGEILRRQKEAKQKKLLMVLGPIFLALMVWQGPGYVDLLTGGDETAAAPVETTPAAGTGTGPAPDPATAPPPSTVAPDGAPDPAAPAGSPATLADSDQPAPADPGQLVSFERFVGKDPFRQIVDTSTSDTGGGGTVTPDEGGGGDGGGGGTIGPAPGGGGDGDDDGGSDDGAEAVAAVLQVNGVMERVALDESFPTTDKLFVLTKLSRTSAWVGLVAGEFSNGKASIEIERGDTLSLVSQPDGIRYTIKLVRVELGD